MSVGFKKATVNASSVPSTQTDFTAYIDLSRVGITTLSEAQSVRVYADLAKTTEWAREIVSATEMWVKIPSLTSTVSMYVDWDTSRGDYGVTATFGRNAVWTGFDLVLHGEALTDATGKHTITQTGTVAYAAGKIGNGFSIPDTANYPNSADATDLRYTGNMYFSAWAKRNSTATRDSFFSKGRPWDSATGYWLHADGTSVVINNPGSSFSNVTLTTGGGIDFTSTKHFVFKKTASTNIKIYANGSLHNTVNTTASFSTNTTAMRIGNRLDFDDIWNGNLDEVRFSSTLYSDDWITTEHNNQSAESTFWGTWSAPSETLSTDYVAIEFLPTLTYSLTKSVAYDVLSTTSIAKSLKYDVKSSRLVTSQLTYSLKTSQTQSKSLTYQTEIASTLTKSISYKVKTSSTISKSLRYVIKLTTTVAKSLKYSVERALTSTKPIAYRVKTSPVQSKSLKYDVERALTVTKSATYRVKTSSTLSKTLTYDVERSLTLSKSVRYAVKTSIAASKSLKYSVKLSSTHVKTLVYRVEKPLTLTKSASYRVKTTSVVSKSLEYRIQYKTTVSITKAVSYSVTVTPSISKSVRYVVIRTTRVSAQLKYVVDTTSTITKPVAYTVLRTSALTLSVKYVINSNPYTKYCPEPYSFTKKYTPLTSPYGTKQSPFSSTAAPYSDLPKRPNIC